MNNCKRCGQAFQHNYLAVVFATINEKMQRMIVCLKCKDILNKKEVQAE